MYYGGKTKKFYNNEQEYLDEVNSGNWDRTYKLPAPRNTSVSSLNGAVSTGKPVGFTNPVLGQSAPVGGVVRNIPTPGTYTNGGVAGPRGSQQPQSPVMPSSVLPPWEQMKKDRDYANEQRPTPVLEVSPYMETMYKSIQNIDPEQRVEYLQTTAASIKERMDKYEFRIARGIPLTPEQQRQYDSIRNAYNDIQKYINNPTIYDKFFADIYSKIRPNAGRLNSALSSANTWTDSRGMPRNG